MARFVPISRGGQAVEPDFAPPPQMQGADVLFTPQGEIRATSPVAAPEPVEPPAPVDPIEFFQMKAPAGEREEYRGAREQWLDAFVDQYHDRKFTSVEDYMDFVTDLQDGSGDKKSIQEILPFIQKQALEYMPTDIRRQYDIMVENKQQDAEWGRQLSKLSEFNDNPANKARGLVMGPDGKIKQVDPNRDFERSYKVTDLLSKRLDKIQEARPRRSDYAEDAQGYTEAMADWRVMVQEARADYYDSLGKTVVEDESTGVGDPGKSSLPVEEPVAEQPVAESAITATNPKTGERIQSFDGGQTWEPMR